MKKMVILLFGMVLFSNCATFTWPAKSEKIEGFGTWFHYDATRRGAYLKDYIDKDGKQKYSFCSEPSPDAANEVLAKLKVSNEGATSIGITGGTITQTKSISPEGSLNQKIVELAGRTSQVLFLRESLYRICELSINRPDLDSKTIVSLYSLALSNAGKISDENKAEAEKMKTEAAANLKVIELEILNTKKTTQQK
jgi:hypothetical protein